MEENKYQVMPDLTKEERERLKEDIKENGLEIPIDVDENGNILDGHERKSVCDELGIPCEKTVHPGMSEEEKFDFAIRVNVNRRHLTQDQMTNVIIKFHKEHPDLGNRAVADAVGVDKNTVKNAVSKTAKNENNDDGGEFATGESHQLQKTTGLDGKSRPASAEKAERQREAIRETINENPDMNNHQVAQATGASDHTVAAQRKKMRSFHNPSARDEKALKDPDIVRRLSENDKLNVAGAIREQKRDQLVEHLEDVETKEAKTAAGVYDVVVVDPPWPMVKIETDARPNQSEFNYPTMSVDEIKDLKIPAAADCHVFLWTTQKFLMSGDALAVLKAWGVKPVWCFVWVKDNGYKPFGLPKSEIEFILYGHVGNPKFVDETNFWSHIDAPARGHSVKPEEFYDMLRRVTAGRRLDMFNRRPIEGFETWGKEACYG